MSLPALSALDAAISQADRLRAVLKKKRDTQIRTADEKSLAKATALAWFNNQRPMILATVSDLSLSDIDGAYKELLGSGDRAASRAKITTLIKQLRGALIGLRAEVVSGRPQLAATPDAAPSFAPLIADGQMQR